MTIQEHVHRVSNQKRLSNKIGMQHRQVLRRHLTQELPQEVHSALRAVSRELQLKSRSTVAALFYFAYLRVGCDRDKTALRSCHMGSKSRIAIPLDDCVLTLFHNNS